MSLAETAELAVNLRLGTTGSFKGATSELAGVEAAAARGTASTGFLNRGFGAASKAATGFGGALGHAKSQLGGLITGPLGLVGLGAGLFTVTGALTGGIEKATEMGKAASRLSAMTGLSVESMSALSAALDHFGVSVDKQLRSVGFLEKNVGLLAAHKDGIKNFEKEFSFALTDANGKLKDANALILQSADYFTNKSIPATTKAAALAKLYGRSWQDLIPFLSAGRKGIQDAEEEARQFGLTLTRDNIGQLAKLREATRGWQTALGGLEVQIGLLVVGPLTDLAKFGTAFIAQNRGQITTFFKNLISSAQQFAGFLTKTVIPTLVSVGSAAKAGWDAVPAPLRDLLVKGFIANKAIKFLFGFDPLRIVTSGLTSGLSSAFGKGLGTALAGAGIGKLFVQPVFVTNMGLGGLGGAVSPGGAVKGGAAGLLSVLGVAGVAAAGIAIVGDQVIGRWNDELAARVKEALQGQRSITDAQKEVANALRGARAGHLGDERIAELLQLQALLTAASDRVFDRGGRFDAPSGGGSATRLKDDRVDLAALARGVQAQFLDAIRHLEGAVKKQDVAAATKHIVDLVMRGRGGLGQTERILAGLKDQLRHTHDPELQKELKAAIDKVEQKVVGREWIQKQLDKADKIVGSSESTKAKIVDLTAIQRTLRDRGDTHAAAIITAKLGQVQAAAREAGQQAAFAIRDKDLSVTIKPQPITVNSYVTVRETIRSRTTAKRAGNVYIS